MRAKLINEKFIEDSDPIHDMGIGLVGTYLRIPQGWERSESNKLYKRFKTVDPDSAWNDWKIIKAKYEGDMIEVTLEQRRLNYVTTDSDLLLTPQQIKFFIKKYQNRNK